MYWFKMLRSKFASATLETASSTIEIADLRKRVRIVVVDDEEGSFPGALLREDGYNVDHWLSLDGPKLKRLESSEYDLLILDIQGIATKELSPTGDGRGVLKRLKDVNPGLTVVAFSGQSFEVDSTSFFALADDVLRKPVSLIQCKEMLDRLMTSRISVQAYWRNARRMLEERGVSAQRIRTLEVEILRSRQRNTAFTFEHFKEIVGDVEAVTTVFGWIKKLIALWMLLH